MTFYRIDEYRICPRGKRGSVVAIPNTVLQDLGAKPGERLSVYRGVIGDIPVAVLANADMPELTAGAQKQPEPAGEVR
jgi:antitoxin component of MazEF toxin-antitoxin module